MLATAQITAVSPAIANIEKNAMRVPRDLKEALPRIRSAVEDLATRARAGVERTAGGSR